MKFIIALLLLFVVGCSTTGKICIFGLRGEVTEESESEPLVSRDAACREYFSKFLSGDILE